MTTDDVWSFIHGLEGKEILTLARLSRFTVVSVTDTGLRISIASSNKERTIERWKFEEAAKLVAHGKPLTTRAVIDAGLSVVHSSYIVAVVVTALRT